MFTIGSIFIEVFLLSIMVARGFLIGLIGQKLCQHALDVVQGFLLSPGRKSATELPRSDEDHHYRYRPY